jgi:hypothetical protein
LLSSSSKGKRISKEFPKIEVLGSNSLNSKSSLSKYQTTKKLKYKIMKIEKGVQYIGRLTNQLTLKEIVEDLNFAQSAKLLPCRSVVKLSLRAHRPKARDLYSKLVYDQIRNAKECIFSKQEKFIKKKKKEDKENDEGSHNSTDSSLDSNNTSFETVN